MKNIKLSLTSSKTFFSILDLCPTGPLTVIKATAIMNIWMKFCNLSLKSMHVLGGIYYLKSPSETDDFCQGIYDTRDRCFDDGVTVEKLLSLSTAGWKFITDSDG